MDSTGSGVRQIIDVDGVPLSALVREVPDPRGVILALHGGATTSAYFDAPGLPRYFSLLHAGALFGFTVVALDRPGYGASAAHPEAFATARQRVDLVYAALDHIPAARERGTFLLAHSRGCDLATQVAADERGVTLTGLALAGIGLHHNPDFLRGWQDNGAPLLRPEFTVRDVVWGPSHVYPPDVAKGPGLLSPSPSYDGTGSGRWPRAFPLFAGQVRIPVHYTVAEHERVWRSDPEALAEVASLFTLSPRVTTVAQSGAGHNLSLSFAASDYHRDVLSFAAECGTLSAA